MSERADVRALIDRIESRKANVGVVGLGYVGLPLVAEFCRAGFDVTGFDVDERKVELLKGGKTYIKHISEERLAFCRKRLTPTTDFSLLSDMDCILVCVPTPLDAHMVPDLGYVLGTAESIAGCLRKGQLVVLESTTYPGTTDGVFRAVLERGGLAAGKDFYLAFSPEREDPNNKEFTTANTPKVVGGYTPKCLAAAKALFDSIVERTVPVSSTRVAEASKLLENIYRAVNIALVNELQMLFNRMDIDVWEVIDTAGTKPFGFHSFYPGPGLGGHCIPIDPFYLTWKAREYDFHTRFIELAGEVNTSMPYYVVARAAEVLNVMGRPLKGARVLVLGVAYKRDVDDKRESPALKIIKLLEAEGAEVEYNDPHVPYLKGLRHYPDIDLESVELSVERLEAAHLALLVTDHSAYDYALIEKHARCILDTRNAFRRHGVLSPRVHLP